MNLNVIILFFKTLRITGFPLYNVLTEFQGTAHVTESGMKMGVKGGIKNIIQGKI